MACRQPEQTQADTRQSGSQQPTRIVTLSPSATALLVALGQASKIVGRDKYSVTPPDVLKQPVIGDFLTPNIEAIAGLKPDLVVLDQSQSKAQNALQTLGLRTLPLAMHQLTDVRKGLLLVGEAVGKTSEAEALAASIDASIADYASRGKNRKFHPRVLAIIDRDPDHLRNLIAAGPNTYIDELLVLVGARNVMAGSAVRYPQISAEQILRGAPDIILDLSKSQGGLAAYQTISECPAVENRRVHMLQEPLLLSPTPQVDQALQRIFQLTELGASL
jgi:ABC-type Fe3+-hydroxamate transport system substrate-binding protein